MCEYICKCMPVLRCVFVCVCKYVCVCLSMSWGGVLHLYGPISLAFFTITQIVRFLYTVAHSNMSGSKFMNLSHVLYMTASLKHTKENEQNHTCTFNLFHACKKDCRVICCQEEESRTPAGSCVVLSEKTSGLGPATCFLWQTELPTRTVPLLHWGITFPEWGRRILPLHSNVAFKKKKNT